MPMLPWVSETLAATSQDEDSEGAIKHGMNPRNRFEAFVVGSNNQFAHAAAIAVSQSNPVQLRSRQVSDVRSMKQYRAALRVQRLYQ